MNSRTEQYIIEELSFGKPETPRSALVEGPVGAILRQIGYLFYGAGLALVISSYLLIAVFFLDRIGTPMPYEVKRVIVDIETLIEDKLSALQEEPSSYRNI